MSVFASLVSVRPAGEWKDEIFLDTVPGKLTVTRAKDAPSTYGGQSA
jgi:hypothetical protein